MSQQRMSLPRIRSGRCIFNSLPFVMVFFTGFVGIEASEDKSQQVQSFSHLTTMVIDRKYNSVIHYNKAFADIINIPLGKLDRSDPLFTDEAGSDDIKLMKVRIDEGIDEKYIIVFSYGPSFDPTFDIYSDKEEASLLATIPGLELYIPGNGLLYASGHADNAFNQRKKYKFHENSATEIKQPFYYVGLKSKTLQPIALYRTTDQQDLVAELSSGAEVEVLVAETEYVNNDDMNFLVKTLFGLVGWTRIGIKQIADVINGIYFAGDQNWSQQHDHETYFQGMDIHINSCKNDIHIDIKILQFTIVTFNRRNDF